MGAVGSQASAESSAAASAKAQGGGALLPLCVDLDGTLVKSDTLVDTVLAIARQRPAALLKLPGWLREGKARFKHHVAQTVQLDVEHLPYNQPLLAYLRAEHAQGRALWLATASDRGLADRVAAFVDIFAGVIATDGGAAGAVGAVNLAGNHKLAAFRERFGDGFSYIGNARPDVPLLTACSEPMTANPDRALLGGLRRAGVVPVRNFEDRAPLLKSWLKAIRLHQWAKNALIFVPLLLAHAWHGNSLAGGVVGFFSFGLCASGTYIINDLLDIDADRRHPRKRRRPFAAGDLPAIWGCIAVVVLVAASAVLAVALPHVVRSAGGPTGALKPHLFAEWLALYTVTTLTYSLYLKRKVLLDVFVLSGLYTVRILAGSAATLVAVSPWLGGFSVFFFLSLAFVKRFSELEVQRERGGIATSGRGYQLNDIEQLRALGTGAAYASVIVTMFYITSSETALYSHPIRLWLVLPVLLLWLSQVWMLASRGQMHDDPVVYAITDKRSWLLGAVIAAIVYSAL